MNYYLKQNTMPHREKWQNMIQVATFYGSAFWYPIVYAILCTLVYSIVFLYL